MTIKDIVFDYVRSSEGAVDFNELTERVLKEKQQSKWNLSHWRWYKTQIVSPNGKYHQLFSEKVKETLSNNRLYAETVTTRQKQWPQIEENLLNLKFKDYSSSVENELAVILGKVTHHIHPSIVEYICQANKEYRHKFKAICHGLCNVDSFLYPNSDCVFPGFRRPINKEKSGQWKNNIFDFDGTILNDNTFPRHIWAFLSMNQAYSGGISGQWSRSGLLDFELAHVFGHKEDERKIEKTVFMRFDNTINPYGLFTSASNVVLVPKGLAKPTDNMQSIKICFYKRHLELYGNNIVGLDQFDETKVPAWYSEIKWLDPALPIDWKTRINKLLQYRENYLNNKYSNYKLT
jgi:hypothetical protein